MQLKIATGPEVRPAVVYSSASVQYVKSFNNQNTAGALMRRYDGSASRSVPELDFAQDSLMAS